MMKKLALVAVALAIAAPAFAKSSTKVTNNVLTVANTGLNFTSGKRTNVTTGDAGATTIVKNNVGSSHGSQSTGPSVTNNVATVANSGANFTSGGSVTTGNAGATTVVVNTVGTSVHGN
jgi:hypothetical protein